MSCFSVMNVSVPLLHPGVSDLFGRPRHCRLNQSKSRLQFSKICVALS